MLRAELTDSYPIDFMEKEENNTNSGNFREIIALLKMALLIYVKEGQYPFDEYYFFE